MPLADNLFDFWPLTSNTLVGAVNGNVLTPTNMAFEAASPGPCWRRNSPTSGFLLSAVKNLVPPFTIAIEAHLPSTGETAIVYYMRGDGNDKHYGLFRSGTDKAAMRTRYGTLVDIVGTPPFEGNAAWGEIAGVWTSAVSRALYESGTLGTPDTTNLAVGDLNLFQRIVVGAMYDGSTTFLGSPENSRFRNLAIWERALTDAELDSYYANPGQLLPPPPAAVLSAATVTSVTPTGATLGASTTIVSGTRQTIVTTSPTPPAQAVGGGFVAGSYPYDSGQVAVAASPWSSVVSSGLVPDTDYYAHHTQWTGANSNILTSALFHTPPLFSVAALLDPVVSDLQFVQNNTLIIQSTLDQVQAALAFTITPRTLTFLPLANGADSDWANRSDVNIRIYDEATGALVQELTNRTTDAQGIPAPVSSASFAQGAWYEVRFKIPTSPPALGVWRFQAS